MTRVPQDKQRIERATRESQTIIALEREAREAKTARLREQRLSQPAVTAKSGMSALKSGGRKAARKPMDVK
ncbi:hypothetical protein [Mesorhizobium sp.]|jgi:hypothetical protein|uniref:hypothetical protein n=1 Tax=Mesorhizobium sp. TaxID=1871066 RepID=UPI003563FF4C